MPWSEVSIMEQRLEFITFASREDANISELCRRFGISRQIGYKWLRRYSGDDSDLSDRSRRPISSPNRTKDAVEVAILSIRDQHPAWGARKIARCLERDGIKPPAVSTVHAILKRHGRIETSSRMSHSYERFEKPAANQLWQMDFKGEVQMTDGGWCYPLTVLDDHSRYALCLQACQNIRGITVKPLLEKTFRLHGLPNAFYLDNGPPWGGGTRGQWTAFGVWLLKLGVDVIHGRPHHPQGRGKIERFHRSLKAEVFEKRPVADLDQAQKRFDRWRMIYNTERPHEALNMDVPADRYQPSHRPMPETVMEVQYDNEDIVRKVDKTRSYINFNGKLWSVPAAFRGETVAIRPHKQDGLYGVYFGASQIANIDLKDRQEHK